MSRRRPALLPVREHHLAAAGWGFRRRSRQHRQNRDRRNRRRWGAWWRFRKSAVCTIVTNAGPHEDDSRGCGPFAGRSVSRESLPGGQHREDAVRTADHCPPPARHYQAPRHSNGDRRSHVAADGICDTDNQNSATTLRSAEPDDHFGAIKYAAECRIVGEQPRIGGG